MGRDSFIFYESFHVALSKLEPAAYKIIMTAVCEYALYGTETELDGTLTLAFDLIKPQIDANNKRYEDGKKGGRPSKKTQKPVVSDVKTSGFEVKNQWLSDAKPNVNVNVNDNVNENVNVNVPVSDTEQHTIHNNIPTMKEIREENIQNEYGLTEDSLIRFVAYNRERGWKMPMPDALRKWKELEKEKPKQNKVGKFGDFQQRDDAKHRTMVSKVIAMDEGTNYG